MKVANVDQMRAIERRSADAGVLWQELMENAGLATALEVKRYVEDVVGLSILVLVGSGNNGGDDGTGLLDTGGEDPFASQGCACTTASSSPRWGVLLVLAALLGLGRRRRRQ